MVCHSFTIRGPTYYHCINSVWISYKDTNLVLFTVDVWYIHVVGRWADIFIFLPSEEVNSHHVHLVLEENSNLDKSCQKKNQGVFVKHYGTSAPGGNKIQKAIFIFNVKVKVTRSLTLVSFEKDSSAEYACKI